ncbi:MAG TPA: hypothetical protein VKB56_13510 [Terriglobales bacterium]|nr:hypothetical protein [Terriglobales bacterium]
MNISLTSRKYWLATLAAAVIYGTIALIDKELIAHHLRAEARYLDYSVLALVAFIFVLVLEDFHERESRRLHEVRRLVADMNHHVRNALQVISYANATTPGGQFSDLVRSSVERIEWALREVLGGRAVRLGAPPMPDRLAPWPEPTTEYQQRSGSEVPLPISSEKDPTHRHFE